MRVEVDKSGSLKLHPDTGADELIVLALLQVFVRGGTIHTVAKGKKPVTYFSLEGEIDDTLVAKGFIYDLLDCLSGQE